MNKTEWILQQDAALAPHEIVTLAAGQGIEVTAQYVSQTRYNARLKAKAHAVLTPEAKPAAAEPQRRAVRPRQKPSAAPSDLHKDFARLAMRIGTDEAQRILDGIGESV